MDAPDHVKEFKFNPKTYQFVFNRARPKIPSQPGHPKYVGSGPFLDYGSSGRTIEVIINENMDMDEPNLWQILFRQYRYKDSLKKNKKGIMVEDSLIKHTIFHSGFHVNILNPTLNAGSQLPYKAINISFKYFVFCFLKNRT